MYGTIPSTISAMTSLQSVDLHMSGIGGVGALPASIGSLTQLSSLIMSFCPISVLPATMSQLTALVYGYRKGWIMCAALFAFGSSRMSQGLTVDFTLACSAGILKCNKVACTVPFRR